MDNKRTDAQAGNAEPASDQRDALDRNMKKATQQQPAEYRDQANQDDKTVQIGTEQDPTSIKGLDPEDRERPGKSR